jgi:hypothetical protein
VRTRQATYLRPNAMHMTASMNSLITQQVIVPRLRNESKTITSLDNSLKVYTTGELSVRYHYAIKEDGLQALVINSVQLSVEHFDEIFYDTKQNDLLAKNCWLYKRVYHNKTEWVLKEGVLYKSMC